MRAPYRGIRRGVPNPLVLGHKFCSRCGRWRHACDFAPTPQNTGSGLYSYCGACNRSAHREIWANRTDEQRELRREYRRFQDEALRRRAGIPPRAFRRRTAVDTRSGMRLDTGPLVDAINRYLNSRIVNGHDHSIVQLSALTGLSERTFNRWLRGEHQHVELGYADRVAVALGIPLALLYPPV